VTWCRDWAKSGLGSRGSGGVSSSYCYKWRCTVRLFTWAFARSQPLASALLPLEKDPCECVRAFSWSHSGLWECRRSQTATCAGKGCHRNTCSRGCAGVSFCPTSIAVRVMAAQYWCLQSDTGGTVTVLPLQFLYALNLNHPPETGIGRVGNKKVTSKRDSKY